MLTAHKQNNQIYRVVPKMSQLVFVRTLSNLHKSG